MSRKIFQRQNNASLCIVVVVRGFGASRSKTRKSLVLVLWRLFSHPEINPAEVCGHFTNTCQCEEDSTRWLSLSRKATQEVVPDLRLTARIHERQELEKKCLVLDLVSKVPAKNRSLRDLIIFWLVGSHSTTKWQCGTGSGVARVQDSGRARAHTWLTVSCFVQVSR